MKYIVRVLLLVLFATASHADTFRVIFEDDGPGPLTLRWAIEQANATPGSNQIILIAPTVRPERALPPITNTVFIEPADPRALTTIDGAGAAGAGGLLITADGVRVGHVIVRNFAGDGVTVTGTACTLDLDSAENNGGDGFVLRGDRATLYDSSAKGNNNGVRLEGTEDTLSSNVIQENRQAGVVVTAKAMRNVVGYFEDCSSICVVSPSSGNWISGNAGAGVIVDGDEARVGGNTIRSNGGDGAVVHGANATFSQNELSFNHGAGLRIGAAIVFEKNTGQCNTGPFIVADDGISLPSPHLSLVVADTTAVTVVGTFDGMPSTVYDLEVIAVPAACNTSQPSHTVASGEIVTDVHGHAAFHFAQYRYPTGSVIPEEEEQVAAVVSRADEAISPLSSTIESVVNRDPRVDLAATLSGPRQAVAGVPVVIDTTITNNGPAAIGSFTVWIPPMDGVYAPNAWWDHGQCRLIGPYSCSINSIGAGQSATIHHQVTFPSAGIYTYSVNAVSAPLNDPNPANNVVTMRIVVTAPTHNRAVVH